MKKLTTLVLIFSISCFAFTQNSTTGRIEKLKDAFGTEVTYVGEIKNKLPNGLGLFIYNNGFALRHAGYFVNGLPEGKGTLLFKDGAFLSGTWSKGKLNGQGAHYSKDKDLYVGSFVNGEKSGRGIYIFNDNGILAGDMRSDKYNGRCLFIGKGGTTLCDNIYVDGKKTGPGLQYEIDSKKLFEGEWKDGDWVKSGTAYTSFLKSSKFYSEKTASQLIMGEVNKSANKLEDSCFFYDLNERKRYLGYYSNGYLQNGVIVRDDSSRFVGTLNSNGAVGKCSFMKVNQFYNEGNFTDDYMNGSESLKIDLKKLSIYYGGAAGKGEFTGKSFYANNSNQLYAGDYLKGKFTGQGRTFFENGFCITGTWEDGTCTKATQITNPKGIAISLKPKSLADAITMITNLDVENLFVLEGKEDDLSNYSFADTYHNSLINLPGSLNKDAVMYDYNDYPIYFSPYIEEASFVKATAKYNELCKQVKATKFILQPGAKPEQLTGEITKPEEVAMSYSSFKPGSVSKFPSGFTVNVFIYKMDDGEYGVALAICDEDAGIFSDDDDWYDF